MRRRDDGAPGIVVAVVAAIVVAIVVVGRFVVGRYIEITPLMERPIGPSLPAAFASTTR
jgi:hypothetical protein